VKTYVEPRATVGIDFIIDARRLRAVLSELEKDVGAIQTVDMGAAVRVTNLAIDLIRGDNHPLFRAALDAATDKGGVRVPPPEILVVLKFLSAVSPWRRLADRKQDAADLIRVYQALEAEFDRAGAIQLARRVYPGAEREFETVLDRIDRGEDVSL
jgi:hypothetical protein